ncbi:5prime-nucleotidase, C-terminal domain [Popillia japonica]|uniref:5'-nucleotidase n=1 Tax=Popillia japonica TaxID=7064 RepID=A0AAW1N3K5_POPJA
MFLDESIAKDLVITRLLETYYAPLKRFHDDSEVFGQSIVYLSADEIRDKESNLGNFIADAFVEFMALKRQKSNSWTDIPIALINSGAIRKSIRTSKSKPNITRMMMSEALPFRQRVVSLTLPGVNHEVANFFRHLAHVLLETLENSIKSRGKSRGGEFLQTSGIRVAYDLTKPIGERVVAAKVYCDLCSYPVYEHINPNKPYNVLVNTFLANGGDGHSTIKHKSLNMKPLYAYELDIVREVLQLYDYIRPEREERVMYVNNYQKLTCGREVLQLYDYIRPEREERVMYVNNYQKLTCGVACYHRSLFMMFVTGLPLIIYYQIE